MRQIDKDKFNRYAVKLHARELFLQYFNRYSIIFQPKSIISD